MCQTQANAIFFFLIFLNLYQNKFSEQKSLIIYSCYLREPSDLNLCKKTQKLMSLVSSIYYEQQAHKMRQHMPQYFKCSDCEKNISTLPSFELPGSELLKVCWSCYLRITFLYIHYDTPDNIGKTNYNIWFGSSMNYAMLYKHSKNYHIGGLA